MDKIKLTLLGTGNAIPTEKRNHTSIHISYKSENMLIDCGEGTQRQLKSAGISPFKITRIFITHWHGDHILGLPGLFQTLAMLDYNKTLHLNGPKGTKEFMKAIEKLMAYYKINIEVKEIVSGTAFENSDFKIEASPMSHGAPSLAYSFSIKEKLRIRKDKLRKMKIPNTPLIKNLQQGKDILYNGRKIKAKSVTYKEEGKKITIVLDTKMNENAVRFARASDILICESTFSSSEKEIASARFHLTSDQAALIAKKSNSKYLILTHISQRYENNLNNLKKEAEKIFKKVSIAQDLQSIQI